MSYHKQVREVSPETCPWLDTVISQLEDIDRLAKYKDSDTIEELQEKLTDIYDALNRKLDKYNTYACKSHRENTYGFIELVRKANDSLRTYACELLEQNEEHEETISQNETTMAELREQVKELHAEKKVLEDKLYEISD
jgi:chromosome segregation ATPase